MAEKQGNQNTSKRGFASMDEEKQRQIASEGGKAAHESGNANEFDSEEARRAGSKGGKEVSKDREHMAEIGRKGGEARGRSGGEGGEDGQGEEAGAGTRGGSSEQHRRAGQQSHKNDK